MPLTRSESGVEGFSQVSVIHKIWSDSVSRTCRSSCSLLLMLRALNSLQLKLFKVSNHRRALLKTSGPRGPVALVALVPVANHYARKAGADGSSDCTLGSEALYRDNIVMKSSEFVIDAVVAEAA